MTKARNLAKLISDNIVGTTEIDDGAVTTAKIADSAVTSAKLSVTGGDISYDNSVSGISATSLQGAIDYLNVLSGGGSAGAQATYTREEFTATAGQTTFTTVNGYTLGYLQVFMNGILLDSGDYTANDQSTVVLGAGAAVNDEITTVAYDSFAISEVLRVMDISASASTNALSIDANNKLTVNGPIKSVGVKGVSLNNNYAHFGSTVSGAMAIFGHNINTDSSSANTVTSANTGYHSSMMKMYYNEGITFHTMNSTATAGDTFYDGSGTTNEKMRIDGDGRVTTPFQPAFSVSGDLSGWNALTNASTHSVIDTWNSNLHFQRGGSNFNPSTGKFTAPVAGYYMFIFSSYTRVPNPSTTNYIYPRFLLNGSTYGFSGHILHYQNHGDSDLGSQISVIIPLAVSDWVSATFYVNGQGDFHANSQRFEGYLIG